MKTLKSLVFLTLIAALPAHAQSGPSLGIAIHLTLGVKQVNASDQIQSGARMPGFATTLGGGSSWNLNRTLLGAEFYYSGGSNKAGTGMARYSGFNSNIYTGYQLLKKGGWQLAPLVGFGISKNQLQLSGTDGGYSLKAVQNAGYIIHTALRIEKVMSKGNYLGLKLGYNIAAHGPGQWKQAGSSQGIGIADDPGGFLLQLNIGGLIRLKN
jgi:hypothetical protein